MNVGVVCAADQSSHVVALAFQKAGFNVTLVVTTSEPVVRPEMTVVSASLASVNQLSQAFSGLDFVYINIDGQDPLECQQKIVQGTKNIVTAAKNAKVKTLGFVSGVNVNVETCEKNYQIAAQYDAELTIKNSGLNYLIFCPSWFIENLKIFLQDGKICLFANSRQTMHWLAMDDFAKMVVAAFCDARFNGSKIILKGPQALTLQQALERYVKVLHPKNLFTVMPVYLAWVMISFGDQKSKLHWANMCRFFESVGEEKNERDTTPFLPAPQFSLDGWCQLQAAPQWPLDEVRRGSVSVPRPLDIAYE